MKSATTLAIALALFLVSFQASAQTGPQEGSVVGNAYIRNTQAMIGGNLYIEYGDETVPNGMTVLSWSDGFCTHTYPGLGPIALDIFSPAYAILGLPSDSAGKVVLVGAIPNDPALIMAPPFYANGLVFDLTLPAPSATWSKTVRVGFEVPDTYAPAQPMGAPRAMLRATSMGQNSKDNAFKVLLTGGGGQNILAPTPSETTEIYNPLDRSFVPGPVMAHERAFHQATLLRDGRILVSGGVDSAGAVTDHAEIYDPATNSFTATAPMNYPRVGHGATVLQDGRVFVAGGLSTFVSANVLLATVLNTSQAHAEIFDPTSGTWSMIPGVMTSKRAGHTQTLVADGRVLLAGGMSGGTSVTIFWGPTIQIPTVTETCNFFDPATNSFQSAPGMAIARAFHGASVLGTGAVLVTGGFVVDTVNATVTPTANCTIWNGTSWAATGSLVSGVAFHQQVASETSGAALVFGGWTGQFGNGHTATRTAGRHNGTVFVQGAPMGTHGLIPVLPTGTGLHAVAQVGMGQFLIAGGSDTTEAKASAFAYHQ